MKTIFTLLITISALAAASTAQAGTIYNVTSNKNWSTFVIPSTCANCTINISSGVTLTIDEAVTCQQCTFNGPGSMVMGSFAMNLQFITSGVTSYFSNINFTINGTGSIAVNAPLSLTNSNFTFNTSASMTTSYQVDMVSSKVYLNDNSKFTANGGGNFNMSSSSEVVVGNGASNATSAAVFYVAGPTLNIYDNSNVAVTSNYSYYENWSNYNTATNAASAKTSHTSYNNASPSSNMNCGGSYPKACVNPNLYGPATVSSAGTVEGATLLPVVLVDFTAELNGDKMIVLSWETAQESNSSHFDIERSQNGSDWTTIGTEQAQGTSATATNYSFTDATPAAGINYYRLNMIDRDGHYTYSDVKIVRIAALVNNISFYPNPARDYVNVSLGQASAQTEVTIRLISQNGQVLMEKKAGSANGSTVTFPIQQYATGLYILSVSGADGSHESSKLLISHS